eukprot:TRINITY_DN40243_c0_g1_i1.p1 TRINITY_DN40243_c0_g1~~TRINITY_DN40243_c0_g1_i1.p1  ORF type:complete len:602 (+),score=89.08 TRINITY_DN40243_c0_g1_i1:295-2100(+)
MLPLNGRYCRIARLVFLALLPWQRLVAGGNPEDGEKDVQHPHGEGSQDFVFVACSYGESMFLEPIIDSISNARPGSFLVVATCEEAQRHFANVQDYPVIFTEGLIGRRLHEAPRGIEDIPKTRVIVSGMHHPSESMVLKFLKFDPLVQSALCFVSDYVEWDPDGVANAWFAQRSDDAMKPLCNSILVPTVRQKLAMERRGVPGEIVAIGSPEFQVWSRKNADIYEVGMTRKRLFGDQPGILLTGSLDADSFGKDPGVELFCEASRDLVSQIKFAYYAHPTRSYDKKRADTEYMKKHCKHVPDVSEICFETRGETIVKDTTVDAVKAWSHVDPLIKDANIEKFQISTMTAALAASAVAGFMTLAAPTAFFAGIPSVFVDSLQPQAPTTTTRPVYPGDTTVDPQSGGQGSDPLIDTEEQQRDAHMMVKRNIFHDLGVMGLLTSVAEVKAWMREVQRNHTIRPGGPRILTEFQATWHSAFHDVPPNPIQAICHELLRLLIEAEKSAFVNEKAELLRQIGLKVPEDGECENPAVAFFKEMIAIVLSSFSTQILIYLFLWWKFPLVLRMTIGDPWDCLCCCCPPVIRQKLSGEGTTLAEPGCIEMT